MSELLKINVNDHTEKKNGLTYLSWAWAWAEVLKIDPLATWSAGSHKDGLPCMFFPDGSAMVNVMVTIKNHTKECFLPVMDHRNKAIKNPDAFAINTAIMRCLAKAISMHGLGLYIYAGEDLPESDDAKVSGLKSIETGGRPMDGAGDALSDEVKAEMEELALYLVDLDGEGKTLDASTAYYALPDNDQKLYVWKLLGPHSKLRASIKANSPHKKAA